MKKLLIIVPILLFLAGNAQVNQADSLKQVLHSDIADTTRTLTLAKLARVYLYSRTDTSLILAQHGIALARQTGFEKGEATGLNMMGNIFWINGDYPKSLEYFLQALKIFERLNDREGLLRTYNNMGNLYHDEGDEKLSIVYEWKSKAIAQSMKSPDHLSIVFSNLGEIYEKLNQLDSARLYTNQAWELCYRLNDEEGKGIALNNLGNIYSKMQQDEIAMGYYHQSLLSFEKTNNISLYCETSLGIAVLFRKAGQADSALYYSRLSLGASSDYPKFKLKASSFLSGYFKSLNMTDSAYHYQEITIAAKDSIFSQEKVKALQNMSFQEQIRQQEIAEANTKAAEERRSNIQMLGIGSFITFFLGFLFIFSKRETNQKAIRFLGLLGLLLLFEFISLFLHPYIGLLTHHSPVMMLLMLAAIASVLVPLHHRLQEFINERLAHRLVYVPAEEADVE